MSHPYNHLPSLAYWRTGVADVGPHGLSELWDPKFRVLPQHRIATAGSCFAQHIGRALSERGYGWADYELAPPFLNAHDKARFNYGVFSFRTGNIYTPSLLLQWLQLAFDEGDQFDEIWEAEGRFFDPLRPAIEPDGFESASELLAARAVTCTAIRKAVEDSDIFVFTLGLTERWVNTDTKMTYAMCPGTLAGTFDDKRHKFINDNARSSFRNLQSALRLMTSKNPKLKVLLTVSPVPLTATASGKHVMTATTYSKSVLRAVAGLAADESTHVDYFPSYEIITHPIFRGMYFAPNMRSVEPAGVATVMQHFFADQARKFGPPPLTEAASKKKPPKKPRITEDVRCEEEMLDAFAR